MNSKKDNPVQILETDKAIDEIEQEVLILPVFQESHSELLDEINQRTNGMLDQFRFSGEWSGKKDEIVSLYSPPGFRAKRLILVGLGEKGKFSLWLFRLRLEMVLRSLRKLLNREIAVYCDLETNHRASDLRQWVVVSALAAGYSPAHYKTEDQILGQPQKLTLIGPRAQKREPLTQRPLILGKASCLARELAFEPGNILNPSEFASRAKNIAEQAGLEVRILEQEELKSIGMNALIAVAQGSREPARMVVLHHRCQDSRPPLLLVGKGVTFDAGGISLKPSQSMEEMKGDKSGAAAVMGAMTAISELRLTRNVVGVIPLVENLPGGAAQRPGDVVKSYSGKTVEIINTDAEGRLILADAIAWAKQQFSPEYIVDIATLTGACVVALGNVRAGYFANCQKLAGKLETAADKSSERIWRLPLDPDYREELISEIADIKNLGSRWGGAVTAAKFLEEFTGDTPWAHIDMAGLDFFQKNQEVAGATGFGAILLTCLAEELA